MAVWWRQHRVAPAGHEPEISAANDIAGLWNAGNPAEMQAILKSLPLDPWMTVETTPLSRHPSDPAMIIP
jgi:muconolactone delta-isomerase